MYVTLVSVVQAIALEVLVSRVGELGVGLEMNWQAAIVWLEIVLLGLTVFYVWVSYTLLVTMAQWVLRVFDFAAAFSVGIVQFVSIRWIGIETIRPFFAMVLVGFVAGALISYSNTRAAAARPENEAVMSALPSLRISGLLAVVGLLGLVGVAAGPEPSALLFLTLLLCNAFLLTALLQWFSWWNRVVRP
jgi:hypothetical protein